MKPLTKRPAGLSMRKALGQEAVDRISAKTAGLCRWCGKLPERVFIDHVFPTSRGGTDDETNLVLSCGSCNAAKCNRDPQYFHRYRCLRSDGFPLIITVRVMDFMIENGHTNYRYAPYPWGDVGGWDYPSRPDFSS
jgi:hypothetical protein